MNTTLLLDNDNTVAFGVSSTVTPDMFDQAFDDQYYKQRILSLLALLWYMRLQVAISLVAAIVNAIVLVVIAKEKSFHNTTNYFIANVMASDLIMAVSCLIDGLILREMNACSGPVVYVQYVTYQVSCSTLILLTLTRYDAILNPLRSINRWNGRRVLTAIGVSWFVSFVMHIPTYYLKCLPLTSFDLANHIYTYVIILVIPAIVIIYCYSRIVLRVMRNKFRQKYPSALKQQNAGQVGGVRAALQSKLTRMVVTILIAFVVLRSPRATFTLYKFMTGWATAHWLKDRIIMFTFLLMNQLNCAVDPFIYAFCAPQFREYLSCLAGKLRCRRIQRESSPSIPSVYSNSTQNPHSQSA